MATFMLRAYLKGKGIEGIEVDSAGTMRHEKPMTSHAINVLNRHKIECEPYVSKFCDKTLFDGADFVFVMTEAHKIMLSALYDNQKKVKLIEDFLGHEVADPYGLGEDAYEQAFADLNVVIPKIVEFLQKQ